MTCQSCGHEIADNAIVCYRCGAPTAIPAARPPAPAPARRGWSRAAAVIVVILIVVLAGAVAALRFGWHLL